MIGTAVFVGREPMTKNNIWEPLANEFNQKGWETIFCEDGSSFGDIGFYCEDRSIPGDQKFTVITINGLDQDHDIRPNYTSFFNKENWGLFDIGIVPGDRWLNGWNTRRASFKNSPRLGVFSVGWFKGDKAIKKFKRPFSNKRVKTILYAPQTEQDGKQKLVVDATNLAGLLLKIKHWETKEYIDHYPALLTPAYMENLSKENSYASQFKNIEICPPGSNFMDILSKVDLLITDQSSVLYEAAMLNIPTLTCFGWKHACGNCKGPQPSPDVSISVDPNELARTLSNIEEVYPQLLKRVEKIRDRNFVNLGNSAEMTYLRIVDIYERVPKKTITNRIQSTILIGMETVRAWLRAKRLKRRTAKLTLKR